MSKKNPNLHRNSLKKLIMNEKFYNCVKKWHATALFFNAKCVQKWTALALFLTLDQNSLTFKFSKSSEKLKFLYSRQSLSNGQWRNWIVSVVYHLLRWNYHIVNQFLYFPLVFINLVSWNMAELNSASVSTF
jgi:hypothetical protein